MASWWFEGGGLRMTWLLDSTDCSLYQKDKVLHAPVAFACACGECRSLRYRQALRRYLIFLKFLRNIDSRSQQFSVIFSQLFSMSRRNAKVYRQFEKRKC